jgi:hypothetical protein
MSYPQMINTCGNTPKNTLNLDGYLTKRLRSVLSTRAAKAGSSRRATLTAVLLLSGALTDVSKAAELKDINNYKLYAHSRIGDFKQFSGVSFEKRSLKSMAGLVPIVAMKIRLLDHIIKI